MELRSLRYFVSVAEHGSMSRAAADLLVSQPALSRQILDLEADLKRKLFTRQRYGVALTAAGRAALPHARQLIADAASLAERCGPAANVPARIRIGHSCGFEGDAIAPLIRPGGGLRAEMSEMSPAGAFAAIRANRVDAIIAVKPLRGVPAGLEGRELWRIRPLVALPMGHRLSRRRVIRLEELSGERWGLWSPKLFPGYTDNFRAACRRSGFRPRANRYLSSLGDIFAHVMAGDQVSFTASIARKVPHPGVALVPLEWPVEQRPTVMLFWKRGSSLAKVIEAQAEQVASRCVGREG